MKRLTFLFILMSTSVFAQTEDYERKYNLLVSKLGYSGVGVETVINNWEKADSTDEDMLAAKFMYYYDKSKTQNVVAKSSKKYLGMEPVLTLNDSLGKPVYYFQEYIFDDELYGKSLSVVDKAILLYPDHIDFRFIKAAALIAYEKESPEIAYDYLADLVKEDAERERPWVFEDEKVDSEFFLDCIHEYCYSLYSIGSKFSLVAFKDLSELIYKLNPNAYSYLNNIGSYYMVAESDYKTALKYYKKVLKKNPDDYIALKNSAVAYRKTGNIKKERECIEKLNLMQTEK